MPEKTLVPTERIQQCIYLIRGQKVMLSADLAKLYGVTVSAMNQAVKRNQERFPADFVFQLTRQEVMRLKSQIVILRELHSPRSLPYAFTEQGVAMLSSVLRSPRAVQVNIAIMRTFVRLRSMLASHEELSRKLRALEQKYDAQFKSVFDAIRQMMTPPAPVRKEIGFHVRERRGAYRAKTHAR